MKPSSWRRAWLAAAALALGAGPSLRAQSIAVVEEGAAQNEIVNISSSGVGDDMWVYACAIDLSIDGAQTLGFCIDPWHWSEGGTMAYNAENLSLGPGSPAAMGATTALQIEQLWEKYYSPTMSDSTAAGLQIAIWDLVSASVEATTDGASWFTLNTSDDYGASSMIAWVDADPTAAAANLLAITGPGQAYVVAASSVPEPPSATIDAATTAYTGSPFNVASTASAPDDNLTLHTIEWLSPSGQWTVSTTSVSGATSNRTLGITFPSTGNWTLRAGASVDNGNTWVYSPSVTVAVSSGLTSYTLESMAVPQASDQLWYSASNVVQQTYQVQHVNPSSPP